MGQKIIQLFAAFSGALGFALISGLRRRHLVFAAVGGMLAWGMYLLINALAPGTFLPNLCAAVLAVAWSEALAHWRKCPATLFLFPAIIPLVPGGTLYEAMYYAVRGELARAGEYGHETLVCALAIAAGISFGTAVRNLHTPK